VDAFGVEGAAAALPALDGDPPAEPKPVDNRILSRPCVALSVAETLQDKVSDAPRVGATVIGEQGGQDRPPFGGQDTGAAVFVAALPPSPQREPVDPKIAVQHRQVAA
jgi:hypothetical protein